MTESIQNERREVHYQGRVQGVGFRYTTWRVTRRFDVVGYVRNLPDGGVLLVAEGKPAVLDRFLAAIDSQLGRYIRDKQVSVGLASGEFDDFAIRH